MDIELIKKNIEDLAKIYADYCLAYDVSAEDMVKEFCERMQAALTNELAFRNGRTRDQIFLDEINS